MFEKWKQSLRDSKLIAAATYRNDPAAVRRLLKEGVSAQAIDTALHHSAGYPATRHIFALLLEKSSVEGRDNTLVEAISYTKGLEVIPVLLEKGTSEAGRDRALAEAVFQEAEKMKIVIGKGVSLEGMQNALGRATRYARPDSLKILFNALEDGGRGPAEIRDIFNASAKDIRRADLTLGVEQVLTARGLLPG